MRLGTRSRPFTEAQEMEGTVTDQQRREWAAQIRAARLEFARKQHHWLEIPETRLVPRGPHFLVDAESDRCYILRRGAVWEPERATLGYVTPNTPMAYTVAEDDTVVFLEEPNPGRTWTALVARKARRGATGAR